MSKKKRRFHSKYQNYTDPVRAKKFLGQHFLKDEKVAKKIGDTLDLKATRNVLEIGPGTGVLTKYLLEKDCNLAVMEVDWDSVAYLKNNFPLADPNISHKNFEVIEADFLKTDIGKLFPNKEFSVIGNFPYNISSQILFRTIENRERIPFFSGMFQKEVAKRICEKPGTKAYGILSVLTQAFYEAEYLFTVPPSVFSPPPKVDSGVLRITRKENYSLDCDEKLFFKVIKRAFQTRRKTLRNSLKSFGIADDIRKKEIFSERPEQLSVNNFVELTNLLDA